MADWPEEGGLDRPSLGPRVPFRLLPDVPAELLDCPLRVVAVVDFGLVVLVVEDEDVAAEDEDRGRVVVVVDVPARIVVVVLEDFVVPFAVVVVVDDLVVDPLAVVVVVDALATGFDSLVVVVVVARGLGGVPPEDCFLAEVVDVVALGTLGSSLAGVSSSARVGPLVAAPTSGDPGGGGIRSSRRAYCMIRANTGADTCPP